MLLCMRTTIDLNDELFRRTKQRAAEDRKTLARFPGLRIRDPFARRR